MSTMDRPIAASEKVLCYIPSEILGLARLGNHGGQDSEVQGAASVVRAMLDEALAANLAPVGLPLDAQRLAVSLPVNVIAKVREQGNRLGLAPGRVVGGLVLALQRGRIAPATGNVELAGLRPQQAAVAQEIAPHLATSRTVLAEVGTGVGKSILMAHLASYILALRGAGHEFVQRELIPDQWLADPQSDGAPSNRALARFDARFGQTLQASIESQPAKCIVISAPTLKDIIHLHKEFKFAAAQHNLAPLQECRLGVVLGRAQFVSAEAIRALLCAMDEPDPAVQEWIEAGLPAGLTESTMAFQQLCPDVRGLMDDLKAIATTFPVDDAGLGADSTDDDQRQYNSLRAQAHECDVLFVTHAMLAVDNMLLHHNNAPHLPRPLALFVDEAHLLEQIQASIASRGLSMMRLTYTLRTADWALCKASTTAARALSAVAECIRDLRSIPADIRQVAAPDDKLLAAKWAMARPTLAGLQLALADLASKLGSAPAEMRRAVAVVKEARVVLDGLLSNRQGSLSFSPMHRHPSLSTGPMSVAHLLAVRWATTPVNLLLSGTLLYAGESGPSAAPVIRELALPVEHTVATRPVHPYWLHSTPTLHLPGESVAPWYVPPEGKAYNPERMHAWLANVAKAIERIALDAAGGTLVLMTGYERMTILQEHLGPLLGERLIVQERESGGVTRAMKLFRDAHARGLCPVWVATGGAWTGLDLVDKDLAAQDDLLLTDLVMPALPFGLNHTHTHTAKVARNFGAEVAHASRLFRQGIGRLVRREGLVRRRLWILDGRLVVRQRLTAGFAAVIRRYDRVMPFQF